MLVALGEVEQKLRQDADLVAEQAVSEVQFDKHGVRSELVLTSVVVTLSTRSTLQVRSVRIESECQHKQMMEFTSACVSSG